jgi:hypothetical protein
MGQTRHESSMYFVLTMNRPGRLSWPDRVALSCPTYWLTREWSPVAGRHTQQLCSPASPKNFVL